MEALQFRSGKSWNLHQGHGGRHVLQHFATHAYKLVDSKLNTLNLLLVNETVAE